MNYFPERMIAKAKEFYRRDPFTIWFATACILLMAFLVIATKEASDPKSEESIVIAIFLSGVVAFCFVLIAWKLPARDEEMSVGYRVIGILVTGLFVGLVCVVAITTSAILRNSNFERDEAQRKIESAKHRQIIAKGINRAKIDSILFNTNYEMGNPSACLSGYLLFKKFADSVLVLNAEKFCNANSDSIAAIIVQYWPLNKYKREYTWSETVTKFKTIVTTANGTMIEYDSIAPDSAPKNVCYSELKRKLLWVIPIPMDYSDLDACIRTSSIEIKQSDVATERKELVEENVFPFLRFKDGHVRLFYRPLQNGEN